MPNARAIFGGLEIYTEDTTGAQSPLITAGRDGSRSITRELVLHAPEDLETLLDECLPQFSPPGRHPSGQPFFVDNVSIRPFGTATEYATSGPTNLGYAIHAAYKATVSYSGLPYEHEETKDEQENAEQNLVVSVDSSGQYELVPSGSLYWEDGSLVDTTISSGITLVSETRYSLTKMNANRTSVPFDKAEEIKGYVNASAYPSTHFAFPSCAAQTLLFTGMKYNYEMDSFGGRKYSYTLEFWKRERYAKGKGFLGWNYFFDPGTNTYRKAFTGPAAGVGDEIYDTFSSNDLRNLLGAASI